LGRYFIAVGDAQAANPDRFCGGIWDALRRPSSSNSVPADDQERRFSGVSSVSCDADMAVHATDLNVGHLRGRAPIHRWRGRISITELVFLRPVEIYG